jgi:hypothetical protein
MDLEIISVEQNISDNKVSETKEKSTVKYKIRINFVGWRVGRHIMFFLITGRPTPIA